MLHGFARSTIDLIIENTGFDCQAITAAHLASLAESQVIEAAIVEQGFSQLQELVADEAPEQTVPDLGQAPSDIGTLCHQLAPLLVDHPQQIGRQLMRLWALCELWPHANRAERVNLRAAWVRSTRSQKAPEESFLTRHTLRSWQRSIPTWVAVDQLSTADLEDFIDKPDPKKAHFCLASYLGLSTDLPTLGQILFTLCRRQLLHRFDDQGRLIDLLAGIATFRRIHDHTPLTMMAVIVSQLAHNLWWYANDPSIHPIKPGSEQRLELEAAIRLGDMTASAKAARICCLQQQAYWPTYGRALQDLILTGRPTWLHAVGCTDAMLMHHGHGEPANPDFAATIAATLAALNHLNQRGSTPFTKPSADA